MSPAPVPGGHSCDTGVVTICGSGGTEHSKFWITKYSYWQRYHRWNISNHASHEAKCDWSLRSQRWENQLTNILITPQTLTNLKHCMTFLCHISVTDDTFSTCCYGMKERKQNKTQITRVLYTRFTCNTWREVDDRQKFCRRNGNWKRLWKYLKVSAVLLKKFYTPSISLFMRYLLTLLQKTLLDKGM